MKKRVKLQIPGRKAGNRTGHYAYSWGWKPRLGISRPFLGTIGTSSWDWRARQYMHPEHRTQEDALRAQKERMRDEGHAAALLRRDVQPKKPTTYLHYLHKGDWYRLVDGAGKSYGKRMQAPGGLRYHDEGAQTRVRRCKPQPESLASELTRLRNREHRRILRGAPGTGTEGT